MNYHRSAQCLLVLFSVAGVSATAVHARSFRPAQVPNGTTIGCTLCHVNLAGGPRNKFGQDVGAITGSANKPFWTAALATKDSDGDGVSNGVELGDPEGDGTALAGWFPTLPGDPSSKPEVSGFAAWQTEQFTLPAEAALASALADPDADGVANLAEYAFRRNPRQPDAVTSVLPVFGADGQVTLTTQVRDDDAKLVVRLQAAGEVGYGAPVLGSLTTSDPVPGDGWKTLRFVDPVLLPQAGQQRYWRLRLELLP